MKRSSDRHSHKLWLFGALIIAGLLIWWRQTAGAPPRPPSQSRQSMATETFDKARLSTSDPTSLWVIVNKQHPLQPKTYQPSDLTAVGNGQFMRSAAAKALKNMLVGAQDAGFNVSPASGYRSYRTQVTVYGNEVKNYGQAVADSESARPGYSEHQTGWAVDLASDGCSIEDCFGQTPGGKWVAANAYRYGFILRYPTGLEQVTGYRAESWHFRYVGKALADELHRQKVQTLEQFFGVNGGPNY